MLSKLPGLLHLREGWRAEPCRGRKGPGQRQDVCATSFLGFPCICDYLRTAVTVMHGQKRKLEA